MAKHQSPRPKAALPEGAILERFDVHFEYPVAFTEDAFDPKNPLLCDVLTRRDPARVARVFPVLDQGFVESWPEVPAALRTYFDAHEERLELSGDLPTLPGGEAAKNDPGVVSRLHELFSTARLDRHAFVLVIGGGAVLDAAGYAAATTHRGLRVVRMPTTVLSQSDSGVGVKNGVNAFGQKNFLGSFAPPFAVVSDTRFLERLPARDARAGLSEAVKVALIRDPEFFARLEASAPRLNARHPDALAEVVQRAAELHLAHIRTSGDPFEQGSARPLDFGHWAAHKLEVLSNHEVKHGEAVAMGLLLDCRYALEVGLLAAPVFDRIERLLAALGLPLWHEQLVSRGGDGELLLLRGLEEFREHLGGELTLTLIRDVGAAIEVHAMDESAIRTALDWMKTRSSERGPAP